MAKPQLVVVTASYQRNQSNWEPPEPRRPTPWRRLRGWWRRFTARKAWRWFR